MSRMKILVQAALSTAVIAAASAIFTIAGSCAADAQQAGASGATVSAASAENVIVETDAATYTMKKIALQGSSLTNADLAALLDSKAAISLAERFGKLTASSVVIPELTVTTKAAPVQTMTYQNIALADVRQGKAAVADIDGAHFSITDPKTGTIDGSYGHMHAQNIDLALSAQMLSEARKDDNEPLKTLYESFSIDGFKMDLSGKEPASLSIGSINGRNVKGRAFAIRPSDFQSASADPTRLAALMKDVFISVDMDELLASDVVFRSETDGQPVTLTLAKISITQFAKAKIGDIDLRSFAMTAQGSEIKVEDIDLKEIDFQKLRDLAAEPKPTEPNADAETEPSQAAIYVPGIAKFILDKIDVRLADDPGAAAGTKGAFSIDHFQVNGGMPIDATPTQVTATLDHFIFNLDLLKDKDVKSLIEMGYSKLDLSSRIEMAWDASAEELTIKDVSLSGENMGAVKISGLIDNVTKDFFSGDATAMQAAAFGALIKKFEIRIDNAGLFEKATAAQAKAQNKSVDEVKRSYVAAAAIGLPSMLDNKPAAKIIGAALAKFIASPKSFELTAISTEGLGAADFALVKDPGTLLDALEIKATANE